MKNRCGIVFAIIVAMALSGCGDENAESKAKHGKTVREMLSKGNTYLVFTNNDTVVQDIKIATSNINSFKRYVENRLQKTAYPSQTLYKDLPKRETGTDTEIPLARKSLKYFKRKYPNKKIYTEGDKKEFFLDHGRVITAVLREKRTIETVFGKKTLYVYSDDDELSDEKIATLSDKFLKKGKTNDIYDWVTNIYGKEWAEDAHQKQNYYIDNSNAITILLTDIKPEEIIGYFEPRDCYIRDENSRESKYSNEQIMFYIDAPMAKNDRYTDEIHSTLAHEFVHLIENYYKIIKGKPSQEPIVAEMLAETTEHIIATKVGEEDGAEALYDNRVRFEAFNRGINDHSFKNGNFWKQYGKVRTFGVFLLHNYGGVEILKKLFASRKIGAEAIEEATGKKLATLLEDFGKAVVNSDHPDSKNPTLNIGEAPKEDLFHDIVYDIHSIDLFSYDTKPQFDTDCASKETIYIYPKANYYCYLGDVDGKAEVTIEKSNYVSYSIINKGEK